MTLQNALTHFVEATKTAVLTYALNPVVQEALEVPLEGWTPAEDALRYRMEELRVLMFSMGHTLSQVPGAGAAYGGPLLGMVAGFSAAIESQRDPRRALTLLEMWLNTALYDLSPQWHAHLTDEFSLGAEQGKAIQESLSPLEAMTFIAVCDTRNRVLEVLHDRVWQPEAVMQSWVEELPFERPVGLQA